MGVVTGGVAPYTYSVDGSPFTATTSYPNMAAGTFAVEIMDVNGCVYSTSATITNTSGPTAVATTVVNAGCGASNGSITLGAVTGGLAPYNILLTEVHSVQLPATSTWQPELMQ